MEAVYSEGGSIYLGTFWPGQVARKSGESMAAKPRKTTASYEHRARDEFEFGRLGLQDLADVANETGSVMCCPF